MLTSWPPGPDDAEDVHAKLVVPDDHLDVLDLRHDRDRREGRVPALGGVEGRDPHQPVDAGLALQVPVGVLAGDLERRRLDPGLVAGEHVDDLDLVAAPLRPAGVHAEEHLRPVLRLGAAGPGVDGEDGVLPVVIPGQDDRQLEVLQLLPKALEARLDLRLEALVTLLEGHLPEGTDVCELARELPRPPDQAREVVALADEPLGAPGVVPESRGRHLRVDGGDARLLRGEVKDAPGGRRAAARRPRARAGARSARR